MRSIFGEETLPHLDQFVLHVSDSDLFGVRQSGQPVGVGMHQMEFVGVFKVFVRTAFGKPVDRLQRRRVDHQVGAGFVQGYRVE